MDRLEGVQQTESSRQSLKCALRRAPYILVVSRPYAQYIQGKDGSTIIEYAAHRVVDCVFLRWLLLSRGRSEVEATVELRLM